MQNFFQTRQEKGAYYEDISVSINTVVKYKAGELPTSHATISDCTDHKASAVWASIQAINVDEDFKDIEVFYIISDSPTSQYRNKFCMYLGKHYASLKNVKIIWIFTEAGHGKGPMDGVGAAVKKAIDNAIAFNPNMSILNTRDIMEILPITNVAYSTYSKEDVLKWKVILPDTKNIKIRCKSFGIESAHEVVLDPNTVGVIFMKQLSGDDKYVTAYM